MQNATLIARPYATCAHRFGRVCSRHAKESSAVGRLLSTLLASAIFLAVPPQPEVQADVITLNSVSVATGVDNGPQDGVFDSFTIGNLGSVNNNGFTSFRTNFEFSLSDLPAGSTINSAKLTMHLRNFEGIRALAVHGYAGDGTVQLGDFAVNGLVATASVDASGTQILILDVTSFVADLVADGETFAGFNVREEPANTSNFLVMAIESGPPVVLSIDFTAEQKAVFLVIDDESIDNGTAPNFFSDVEVNDHIAEIGVRSQVPYFAANVGSTITLQTGQVGDEGWFALKKTPDTWVAAGPTPDGLRNYLGSPSLPFPHNVGPGLGTPAPNGDREALLDKVADVTPLRAAGLKLLEGKRVCAVVYDSDIGIDYNPLTGSLRGANLGTVAFEVISVTPSTGFSSSSLPEVEIRILDSEEVCEGALTPFADAPEPISSSEPFDVVP